MRLVRAHIRGYRCLDDLRIDFDEVVVLVGANSTGKSSVLHALEWFFNGGLLDPEDLGGLDPVASVSVSATFADLSDTDAEVFGSYVDGEEMTLWRTWSSADGEKLTGRALAYSPFETVRSNERRGDLNNAYRELREADPSLGLPSARSADAALVAMQEWEAANPDRLASSTVSATHLFGFAGHGRLAGRFDFVLIPAVSDPGSETRDARGTLLRQLVDRAGPHSESMRRRLDDLGDDLTRRVGSIVDEEGLETFDQVSNLVSGELAQLVPHGTVRVEPRMPVVRIPEIGFAVRVADGGIETELTRQGHGFQRALFIALVRQLAKSDGEGDPPGLFIAIEEPELYQHPVQARHFARTLAELARPGDGAIQVAYATHSEYFIDPAHYERLRRFRKQQGRRDWPTAQVSQATVARVAERLDGVVRPDQVALRVRISVQRQLAEAVFAEAVLLVEGRTDSGFIHGLADRDGGLDAAGVGVVAVMGKHQMLVPLTILDELGVPTYVVFDGDADLETRMLADGKDASAIGPAVRDSRKQNRLLLAALGGEEVDQPPDQVHQTYAVFHEALESAFNSWPAFVTALEPAQAQGGDWREKSEDAYRHLALAADDPPPAFFSELIYAIRARKAIPL